MYGETTTGAESDIQQLTQIARGIVGRWGMSDVIGPVAVIDGRQGGPLLPGTSEVSEHTQRLIDEEVRRVIEIFRTGSVPGVSIPTSAWPDSW